MSTIFRALVLVGVLGAGDVAVRALPGNYSLGPAPKVWFAQKSPWNLAIGSALKATYSDAAISAYVARAHSVNMNWGSAGVYVVYTGQRNGNARDLVFGSNDRASQCEFRLCQCQPNS